MPGPARAGALLFARDLPRLSGFYQRLLDMQLLHADDEHHVIESSDMQLVVHAIPAAIAATFTIDSPPVLRDQTAVALFFTVDSLAQRSALARTLGGDLSLQTWEGPGFRACKGNDPEGNVFQLREVTPRP